MTALTCTLLMCYVIAPIQFDLTLLQNACIQIFYVNKMEFEKIMCLKRENRYEKLLIEFPQALTITFNFIWGNFIIMAWI